ncbi:hypothetical protein SARC_03556 [Sphaeroforma arctica JP610]|uniref:Uncharacterized protein n=1 Tax=Sphaeroforma arctica JP610 TaxID=667725 RepID=A0A0L0G5K3_9EUKA|nr:hypothetical protein SARC_03556 [Sphaeroforma arctica JP610]KNC84224.1 hypothetical protein SARC_03556 [Sphaeroforma arctica JP610]|eukprot:XP_014158126.1 hypothetical protein SARC_03556 [Sphaeroforma arctica JP610]
MRQIYQTPMLTRLRSPANGGLVTNSASTSPANPRKTSPNASPMVSTKPSFQIASSKSNLKRGESGKVTCIVKTIEALNAGVNEHSDNRALQFSARACQPPTVVESADGPTEESDRKSTGPRTTEPEAGHLDVPKNCSDDSFVTAPESESESNASNISELEYNFHFTPGAANPVGAQESEEDTANLCTVTGSTSDTALDVESEDRSMLACDVVTSTGHIKEASSPVLPSICEYNRKSLSSRGTPSEQFLSQETTSDGVLEDKVSTSPHVEEAVENNIAKEGLELSSATPLVVDTYIEEVGIHNVQVEKVANCSGSDEHIKNTDSRPSANASSTEFVANDDDEHCAIETTEIDNAVQNIDARDISSIQSSFQVEQKLDAPTHVDINSATSEVEDEPDSSGDGIVKSSVCNERLPPVSGTECENSAKSKSTEKPPLRSQVSSIVDSLFETVSCEMLAQKQANEANRREAETELARAEHEAQDETQASQNIQQPSERSADNALFPLDMPPRRLSKVQRMLGEEVPEGGPMLTIIDNEAASLLKSAFAGAHTAQTNGVTSQTSSAMAPRCTRQSTEEEFRPHLVHRDTSIFDGMLIGSFSGKGKEEYKAPPKRKVSTEQQQLALNGPGERKVPVSADEARRMQIYGTLPIKGRHSKESLIEKGTRSNRTSPLCKGDRAESAIGDLIAGNCNPRLPMAHPGEAHPGGASARTQSHPNRPGTPRRTTSAQGSDLIPNQSNHSKLGSGQCTSASVPNLSDEHALSLRALQGRKGVASEELLSIASITSGHPLRKHCHKRSASHSNGTQSSGTYPLSPNKHSLSHNNQAIRGRGGTLHNRSSSESRRRASSGSVSQGSMSSGTGRSTMSRLSARDAQLGLVQGTGANWTGTLTRSNSKHLGQELIIFGAVHVSGMSRSCRVCHTQGRGTVPRGASAATSTLPRRGANMKDVQDFRSVENGRLHYRIGVSVNASTPQTVLMDCKGELITRLSKQHKFMGMTPTVYVEDLRTVAVNGRVLLPGKVALSKQKGVRVLTYTKSITINDTLKEGECINVFFCKDKEKAKERKLADNTKHHKK